MKKLYVLAKIVKRPCGEYDVTFLYSDKEKSFKRIAECTPEIQKAARHVSINPHISFWHPCKEGYYRYFDCNTKEIIAFRGEIPVEHYKRSFNFALDSLVLEKDEMYIASWAVVELCYKINDHNIVGDEYKYEGKVFIKCGKKAKEEIEIGDYEEDLEKAEKIISEYL